MEKSTHRVDVIQVKMRPHENADFLSLIEVYNYTVCVRTADWKDGDLAAYIPPDSVVDTNRPEFAFLKTKDRQFERIRVKKLRGVISMGLLVPAPPNSKEGDDVAELLGVTHYEPSVESITGGDNVGGPNLVIPKYDIDSLRRYLSCFIPGETVYISEKIHGANSRYVFHNGQMYCGSRTNWKVEDERSIWWQALKNTPSIIEFCQCYPDFVLFGEVYGQVQNLRYDIKSGVRFAAFDILNGNRYLDVSRFLGFVHDYEIPRVPTIAIEGFDWENIQGYAEGQSLIASHVREGCVVRPVIERTHPTIGRVILKLVGNGYYQKG